MKYRMIAYYFRTYFEKMTIKYFLRKGYEFQFIFLCERRLLNNFCMTDNDELMINFIKG